MLAVLFYSSSLYMVCVATIVSVVVVNLARNHHDTPLPWLLKKLLTGWLGQILCLGHIIDQVPVAAQLMLVFSLQVSLLLAKLLTIIAPSPPQHLFNSVSDQTTSGRHQPS
jgi:hypothetical protein